MPLTIVNNRATFGEQNAHSPLAHLGTRDRDNPANRFDFPGKASALLKAAIELQQRVANVQQLESTGSSLQPIKIIGSSRFADEPALLKVHSQQYLDALKGAADASLALAVRGEDQFIHFGKEADVTPGTYNAARHSVGTAFDAIDIALKSKNTTAFALVWPPGHHAEPDQAMGFCYLSTAALAALYAREHAIQLRPGSQNRVLIIDIDHHRGNGTARAIASKENLALVDMTYLSPYDHQNQRYLDGARAYPYTHDDPSLGISKHPICQAPNVFSLEFEGFQKATTILDAFIARALPFAHSVNPDIVLWSLGLDAAKGDLLGGLGLIPSAYYTLIKGMRLAFPEARHCGVLEGGYEQRLSARCLKPSLMALHDEPSDARSKLFKRYRDAFIPNL